MVNDKNDFITKPCQVQLTDMSSMVKNNVLFGGTLFIPFDPYLKKEKNIVNYLTTEIEKA